jgi:hypothetical protein
MSLPQGDGPSGSSIVTLHVSPRTKASDAAIRDIGANSKIIIRLLDHEPVFKLYEHLMAKWKLTERSFDVVFFFNGTRACLSDKVSQYLENGKPKVSFEFELIPSSLTDSEVAKVNLDSISPTTTASSTPVPGSPVMSVKPAPVDEPLIPEPILPLNSPSDVPVAPVTTSNRKSSKSSSRSRPKTAIVTEEPVASAPPPPVEAVPAPPIAAISPIEYVLPVASNALVIPSSMTTTTPPPSESVYKEMLDRERDIFMTLLESQARWMSQMQAQMTSTCLAVQENAFRMLGRGSDKEDDIHEFKKQRKQ